MIHVIMGLKGSGKTKKLVDSAHEAIMNATGDVVCIEYGKKLTYELPHRVRLVDSKEYGINNSDMLKGLLSGLHAGNFDITNVYVDNLYKSIGKPIGENAAMCDEFIAWAESFAEANNMNLTFTVSDDPATASPALTKYL